MNVLPASLLLLGLIGAAGHAQAANNCTIALKGDDSMKFDLKQVTVSASCPTITIQLAHPGTLPAAPCVQAPPYTCRMAAASNGQLACATV